MHHQPLPQIWVFSGAQRHFPGGLFFDRSKAEKWIFKHRLTGTLTLYPVDVGAYEWAIETGLFTPRKPHELSPEFIGGFSDAGMEHYHYEEGRGGSIPSASYWEVIKPVWTTVDLDTPESFERTFAGVRQEVGHLYAAHFCQSEVSNGGFKQFFSNSTGLIVPEAIAGFAAIGQPQLASLVSQAMFLLGVADIRDRGARQNALSVLQGEDQFATLEKEFYELLDTENDGFEFAADQYASRIDRELDFD